MAAKDGYVVGGVSFNSEAEAKKAEVEQKRIDALNAKMNYEDIRATLTMYQKAQANSVFQTPVGIAYMIRIREYLLDQGIEEEKVPPILMPEAPAQTEESAPATENGEGDAQQNEHGSHPMSESVFRTRIEAQKAKVAEANKMIKFQWYVMIAMGVIIIAMFVISLTGNNPTIVNYRSKILNQYSEWEQELREREAAVAIKEQGGQISGGVADGSQRVIDTE